LGDKINSSYSEHSPVITADESLLIFTSKKEGSTGDELTEDGQYYEDIYISSKTDGKWEDPISISPNINTTGHEATIGLSQDGQQLLIYRDDLGDGNIYISELKSEGWSVPKKLGPTVNTKFAEKHATFAANGRTIYFSSDRKGGHGGFDIYAVKRLPNGKWGDAQNLGPKINTEYNEEGPYIHPDGVTLYFSSEGHETMGGYDIFQSTLNHETAKWTKPENIGFPINTTEDDVFYVPTVDGKRAYYSSFQKGGFGSYDLYMINLPDAAAKELTVYTGLLYLFDGNPPNDGYITVNDKSSGLEYGIYTPNMRTGKYLFILPTNREFEVTYMAGDDLSYNMNLIVEPGSSYNDMGKAIHLPPVVLGGDNGEYILTFEDGEVELNDANRMKILSLSGVLKNNPKLIAQCNIDNDILFENLIQKREENILSLLTNSNIEDSRFISSFNDEEVKDAIVVKLITDDTKPMDVSELHIAMSDEEINELNEQAKNNISDEILDKFDVLEITDILFGFDKDVTSAYNNNLNTLSAYLLANENVKIKIVGHTDDKGTDEYNLKLSERRIEFVKNYLLKKGVSHNSMISEAKGEKEHIADNSNETSSKFNRRVEIYVLKEGKQKIDIQRINVPDEYKAQ